MRLLFHFIFILSGCICAQSISIVPGAQVIPVENLSVRLEFETMKDVFYQIESSENLTVWKREGYAFPGNGQKLSAMVSNHGLPRLFYRVGNNATPADTAPINPYGFSNPGVTGSSGPTAWSDITGKPTTLSGLGVATGTSDLLREIGASGYNALSSDNNPIWRLIEKFNRERSGGSLQYSDRFRSVSFGDSVASRINNQATGFWGYGGGDANLFGFAKEAPPTPATQTPAAYPDWSAGVFTLFDEWERVPGGVMVHLDAAIPGGTFVERTNYTAPMHSVVVTFMARKSNGAGAENYGSFKIQYKINNSGSWIDSSSATVPAGKGTAAGGVVSTDNDSPSESIGLAFFDLPRSDTYAVRLLVTAGRVRLVKALFNNGGLKAGPADQIQLGGSIDADFSLAGRGIASHFSRMTQQGLNDALGYIDPHVVVYKSANEWSLDRYQAYWPELAGKIMAAAPDATLIVAGSHPQNALREQLNAAAIAVDDFLREWCANTAGAIFVDVRQNFPAFKEGFEGNTESIDDLWADGVHIGGKGEYVVSQLVWDAIKPAMDYAKIVQQSNTNWSNILPMVPTEIRLFDQRAITNRTNKLALTVHPRVPASLMIRSTSAPYFSGNQSWLYESGLWVRASTDVYPSALSLFSDGQTALTFGHHQSLHALQGLAVGIGQSHTTNAARAADGYRFRVVSPVYGKKNGLIVEGRTDSPTDTRLLGIDVDSTDQNPGSPLWSWMEDGTVIHEGTTPDNHQMTLRFADPAEDVTITTPAKTGTIGVVPAHASRAAAITAGLTAGDNYWNTTTGSLKTILP
jgi:hypothetical protein